MQKGLFRLIVFATLAVATIVASSCGKTGTSQTASVKTTKELELDQVDGWKFSATHTTDVNGKTLVYFYGAGKESMSDYSVGLYDYTVVAGYKASEPYEVISSGNSRKVIQVSQSPIRKKKQFGTNLVRR